MADLLTLSAVKRVENILGDARKEGYPVFNQWGGAGNQNWICTNYDSHFQPVNSPWAAAANSTTSYRFGLLGDPMIGYSNIDFANADSQLSSQGYTSWNQWQQSLHQNDQYPQSAYGSVSALGMPLFYSLHNSGASTKLQKGYMLINQVMPEGIRPRRFFGMYDNTFMEYAGLTQMNQNIDSIDLSTYATSRTATEGRGSAGYNENTRTLVTIHSNNTTAWTITKFVGKVDLNSCETLEEFFNNATVTEYNHSAQANDAEARYDKAIVVGDNNRIGVSYRIGNDMYGEVIDLSDAGEATITLTTIGGTTSYGMNQGVQYYTKVNTTWDGKWAAAYQPYYYYGCGIVAYIFSTEDPRRNFRIQNTTTAGGGALFPIGKSGFVYFNGQNADSNDVYMVSWDFKTTNKGNYTEDTRYAHSNTSFNSAVPAIANGGMLNSSISAWKSGMSGNWYSTTYPRFMTVNYWPLNGKTQYEGDR